MKEDFLRWTCRECNRFLMNVDLAAIRKNADSKVLDTHCTNCNSDNILKVFRKGKTIQFEVRNNYVKKKS